MTEQQPALRRTVGPVMLALYGAGSMMGAGIYGLIGEAAGVVGAAVWLSFLVSLVAALLTGVSYASLASRYPKAGGAAYVVQRAYGSPGLAYVAGLAVAASGLTSAATQSRVVAENLHALFHIPAPGWTLSLGFLLLIGAVLWRGVKESLAANALCTVVEASGLLLVIVAGARFWGQADLLALPPAASASSLAAAALVMQGAVLTFFAFIGFEDMLNVAEEARDPARTMPVGIIAAMAIVSVLYMGVAITAVSVARPEALQTAPAPLGLVLSRAAPGLPGWLMPAITLFAVANSALINALMGSRLLYGMANQRLMPAVLGRVHARRRTPHVAIAAIIAAAALLSFAGDVAALAQATVLLLLTVFCGVNLALLILRRREGRAEGRFNAPLWVPAAGALVCAVLIAVRLATGDLRPGLIALALIAAAALLYALVGRRAGAAQMPD